VPAFEDPTVKVKFELQRKCHFGQQFKAVGCDSQFGDWDPSAAVPLEWSEVQYVAVDEIPASFVETEKEDLAKRPEAIREKIVPGRAELVRKGAEEADSFGQECVDLNGKAEKLVKVASKAKVAVVPNAAAPVIKALKEPELTEEVVDDALTVGEPKAPTAPISDEAAVEEPQNVFGGESLPSAQSSESAEKGAAERDGDIAAEDSPLTFSVEEPLETVKEPVTAAISTVELPETVQAGDGAGKSPAELSFLEPSIAYETSAKRGEPAAQENGDAGKWYLVVQFIYVRW
jgi:hypothetical protein